MGEVDAEPHGGSAVPGALSTSLSYPPTPVPGEVAGIGRLPLAEGSPQLRLSVPGTCTSPGLA